CSDQTANTDLDLHLHRPNNTLSWFSTANGATCYYENCKAQAASPATWGYANSPLAACVGGPEGTSWAALGFCRNPRLDIDSIQDSGVPENINVDVPEAAAYRVMVNYFGGTGTVHPVVNVYCGGRLRGSYGQQSAQVSGFDQSGGNATGDMWRVVDVTPVVSNSETTDCALAPLHPPGMSSGYWVSTTPRTY
ncbi:MAG TPA: hypothetical protein VM513_11810, partial [Kofleriaceae bacterium]|nr:hypothetical protein [Kofleriaceae bacterium]